MHLLMARNKENIHNVHQMVMFSYKEEYNICLQNTHKHNLTLRKIMKNAIVSSQLNWLEIELFWPENDRKSSNGVRENSENQLT